MGLCGLYFQSQRKTKNKERGHHLKVLNSSRAKFNHTITSLQTTQRSRPLTGTVYLLKNHQLEVCVGLQRKYKCYPTEELQTGPWVCPRGLVEPLLHCSFSVMKSVKVSKTETSLTKNK